MSKKVMLGSVALFVLFTAWTPWISQDKAKQMFARLFVSGSLSEIKTCSLRCSYCAVSEPKKVPFGYEATVESNCNRKSDGAPTVTKKDLFLSLLGTIHGL